MVIEDRDLLQFSATVNASILILLTISSITQPLPLITIRLRNITDPYMILNLVLAVVPRAAVGLALLPFIVSASHTLS